MTTINFKHTEDSHVVKEDFRTAHRKVREAINAEDPTVELTNPNGTTIAFVTDTIESVEDR